MNKLNPNQHTLPCTMSEAFSIKMDEMGVKVVSNIMVRKNINVACISSGKIIEPTYQTVQVGIKTHLLENTLLAMNYSCDPNVYIDAKNMLNCLGHISGALTIRELVMRRSHKYNEFIFAIFACYDKNIPELI
ncbi:MAG: hypothetical protein R1F54_06725 [Candidatus Zeuxoniibacter abyssi]|nr:MAG: hypothetical protein R1F54_06725 [Candidatus Persebacteraceae bacterium AB1(2)]